MKVLIVAAHPDDEVLGCGGFAAKLSAEGAEVYSLLLSKGVASRHEASQAEKVKQEIKRMEECVAAAAKVLGFKESYTLDLPDNQFDSLPNLAIVKEIEKIKRLVKPSIVLTHHRNDLNVDHRVAYNAVLTACRPLSDETVKELYSFETLSSTEWNYPNVFSPTVYVGISGQIARKKEALQKYASEVRDWPHPRSLEAVDCLAKYRGCQVGLEYAEVYELIRMVK